MLSSLLRPFRLFQGLTFLFGGSRHPLQILYSLFWGFPASFPLPDPLLTPAELRQDSNVVSERHDGIIVLRHTPLFTWRDTPLRSIYRMYEFLCIEESNQLMLETRYFWDSPWKLGMIPDPGDANLERYAVIASIVESLELAFRYRYSLGSRRPRYPSRLSGNPKYEDSEFACPSWTSAVPRLSSPLILTEQSLPPFVHSNPFSERNIVANAGNMFSI
ncbi:hypothetical protein K431DRAFT_231406 [Polychaeton citri CBS 116435]|uniref:Uncharacterized protein n=1 Tax=Polychaeton citri CBS 116435 TaxID=1314669 RepID=A0A9P4Q4T3_9PEZI|nr:hypothetical protein K431DRAFT_231406 [Polychaeton citri CBS 116435]